MKCEERQLLYCLSAFRLGEKTAQTEEALSPEQWRNLYELAGVHKLIPVVFETLWNTPGFCGGEQALFAAWKRDALLQSMDQTRRTRKLLEVTEALRTADIVYAVVKGAVCRQLYHWPDLRPSGDEDLLIPANEREKSRKVLMRCGLKHVSLQQEEDVEHWVDAQTGLHIELHSCCFSTGWEKETFLNAYFESCLQETVPLMLEQGSIMTLRPTENIFFLIAHALKHFITGGFGVRTWADILSYCEKNGESIDRTRLWTLLEEIHGAAFFRALLRLGKVWLGFETAPWGCLSSDSSDDNDLLSDMLAAGIYGQTSMDRRHSGALSLQLAQGEKEKTSLRLALFPPANKIAGRYPILNKVSVLLPAIWMHRIGVYVWELLRDKGSGNSPAATVSLGKKRTEMMKKYGIFSHAKTENR